MLTWHVHGSYLNYLSRVPVTWLLPVRPARDTGYVGRGETFDWPDNVIEVPAEEVCELDVDLVLTQSRQNWEQDRHELLGARVPDLPRVHLEHDPPPTWPNDAVHPVQDPDALLVHVTPYNALMWDSGSTPHRVVEHGVAVPEGVRYTGELERGVAVVNNLPSRGRRVGADVFRRAREAVPLDLAGMGSEAEPGGIGEIPHDRLPTALARYRFLFNPIRYTSLGLSVCEAMMLGVPVVALATTEYATAVENGVSGYAGTRVELLVERMRELLADPGEARRLGDGARRIALERFAIDRFVRDWNEALALVTR